MNSTQALVDLQQRLGRGIVPEDVVNDAEDPKSPLHRYFDWDDASAAHTARCDKAAHLIRICKVNVRVSPSKTVEVRAFINVREHEPETETEEAWTAPAGEYYPIEEVAQDALLVERVLAQMKRDYEALKAKYSDHRAAFAAMVAEDAAA